MDEDSLYLEGNSMKKQKNPFIKLIMKVPEWLGTPLSLFLHAAVFIIAYLLIFLGLKAESVQLTLTTLVSIEAIFQALLIQMTINQHHKRIKDIEEDVEDILEDTEELTEEDNEERTS